jgi:NADH-quinone oxidoreductase subunit N
VIDTPHVDWFALAPVLSLLAGAAVALLAAVLVPASIRRATAAGAAGLGYAGAIVFGVLLYTHSKDPSIVAGGGLSRDRLYACAAVLIGGIGIATVLLAARDRMRDDHIAEYFSLLAVAGAGMVFFVGSSNLMTLFLALEWFSISLYILCAIDGDNPSGLEAGLKYLVTGGFGSAILLFGSALVYGATGKIGFTEIGASPHGKDALLAVGLAMLIVGLGFKSSAAPFHQWTPDVYEGAPTTVTAFMSSATKVAALLLTLRLLLEAFPQEAHLWSVAAAVLACASLAIGNLGAIAQKNVKRILAYSSVSHAGFLLIAIAANNALGARALLFYLLPYSAMSLGSFAVVAARERELGRPVAVDDLAGFGWERPLLGLSFWLFLFGFAGFPLTGGFWAKIYVFSAAVDRGWNWLVVVGVVATMVSLVYYLNLVRVLYLRADVVREPAPTATPAVAGGSPPSERLLGTAVFACAVVTVGTFIFVGPLTDIAKDATAFLPF